MWESNFAEVGFVLWILLRTKAIILKAGQLADLPHLELRNSGLSAKLEQALRDLLVNVDGPDGNKVRVFCE